MNGKKNKSEKERICKSWKFFILETNEKWWKLRWLVNDCKNKNKNRERNSKLRKIMFWKKMENVQKYKNLIINITMKQKNLLTSEFQVFHLFLFWRIVNTMWQLVYKICKNWYKTLKNAKIGKWKLNQEIN